MDGRTWETNDDDVVVVVQGRTAGVVVHPPPGWQVRRPSLFFSEVH
jgi:hypothetical protein